MNQVAGWKNGAGPRPSVIIIGGGFSGTMLAVQLASRGVPSTVVDPASRPARGLAYSTRCPQHLLNVRAANMSALPDQPDDFVIQIAAAGGRAETFARRMDYGNYLASKLEQAVATGLVKLVTGKAMEAKPTERGWQVRLANGDQLEADTLVLATGNAAPAPLAGMGALADHHLIDPLWSADASARLEQAASNDEPVLIVGTGLTMVDTLITLDVNGHRGPITAVSRRGLLPRVHRDSPPSRLPPPALEELPGAASGLLRWLRQRAQSDSDWRHAIDALRPLTQQLWQGMEPASQRRFLRHGRAWWDVHRHRLAPQIHGEVTRLEEEGRLHLLAGRILGSERQGDRYLVGIAPRRGGGTMTVEAGLVVNCTGPLSGLRNNPDPLIAQMLADKLLKPDALDLGAEIDGRDRLAGFANAYAIGPVARGRYWEITAVPDLRGKTVDIASAIAADWNAIHREEA